MTDRKGGIHAIFPLSLIHSGASDPAAGSLRTFAAFPLSDQWHDTVVAGFAANKTYVVETSPNVVERCMLMATEPGDLVLDPTCGSGTTAVVAEKWDRRWITCDTSRVSRNQHRTVPLRYG